MQNIAPNGNKHTAVAALGLLLSLLLAGCVPEKKSSFQHSPGIQMIMRASKASNIPDAEEAAEIYEQAAAEDLSYMLRQRMLYYFKAARLWKQAGNPERELRALELAVSLAQQRMGKLADGVEESPEPFSDDFNIRRDMFVASRYLGDAQSSQGLMIEALASYRAGYEIAKQLADESPEETEPKIDLSIACQRLGRTQQHFGNLAGAEDYFEAAYRLRKHALAEDRSNTKLRFFVSSAHVDLAEIQRKRGALVESRSNYLETLPTASALVEEEPKTTKYQRRLAFVLLRLVEFGVEPVENAKWLVSIIEDVRGRGDTFEDIDLMERVAIEVIKRNAVDLEQAGAGSPSSLRADISQIRL